MKPGPRIVDSCHPLLLAAALARERHRSSWAWLGQPSCDHPFAFQWHAVSQPSEPTTNTPVHVHPTPSHPSATSSHLTSHATQPGYTRLSPAQWLIAEACALLAGALRPRRNLLQSRAPLKWDAHQSREHFPAQNAAPNKPRTCRSRLAGVRDKQAPPPMRATWKMQARANQSDRLPKKWLEVSSDQSRASILACFHGLNVRMIRFNN